MLERMVFCVGADADTRAVGSGRWASPVLGLQLDATPEAS